MARIVLSAGLAGILAAGVGAQAVLPERASLNRPDREFVDQYCVTCHNDRLKTGGLTLETLDFADVQANAEVLEKIIRKLRSGQMPPERSRRPDSETVSRFVTTLEAAIDRSTAPNPGQVASHRLKI